MKRAAVLAAAVLLALVLVYPAVTASARTPRPQDLPPIGIITPQSGDNPAFSGDGDGGDADDLAGLKERKKMPDGSSGQSNFVIHVTLSAKVWRLYLFGLGLYR